MTESEQIADARRFSPATQRNREPLLKVLAEVLPENGRVLEIASGTGEHAVWFAPRLPGLHWQTSDPDPDLRQSIASHAAHAGVKLPNPLDIDVTRGDWGTAEPPLEKLDAIFCANMIHIAPWSAALGLLDGAARHLKSNGKLCLYGPYKRDGDHTAASNADFDRSLRSRDPAWGIRDLEKVSEEAEARGLQSSQVVEMPSNNLTVIFERAP